MSWKDFPQLKTRRGNHAETSKRSRDVVKSGPYSQVATNKWVITIAEVLPREKGSCRGKTRPQKPGFENQQVLHSEDPGDCRGHRLHSCRAHRKPHMLRAQGRGSTWEEAGLGTLADLGEPPGEAVGPETPPGEGGDGSRHSGSSFYRATWVDTSVTLASFLWSVNARGPALPPGRPAAPCPPWLHSQLPGKLTPPSLCSQPSPEGGLTAS